MQVWKFYDTKARIQRDFCKAKFTDPLSQKKKIVHKSQKGSNLKVGDKWGINSDRRGLNFGW